MSSGIAGKCLDVNGTGTADGTAHDVSGRSRMSREELLDALARAGRRRKKRPA
ncbi:hypothetical protein [Streptomyces sp. NPDC092370]|uniref:hypothetical protein n=1 Tax=Streptomyces sp. NPDC092370 TaxID=3366016 RepID=UPI0038098A4E